MARHGRDRALGMVHRFAAPASAHARVLGFHPQQHVMGGLGLAHQCLRFDRARVRSTGHECAGLHKESARAAQCRMIALSDFARSF